MLYEYYSFPLDYLDKYRANIEKITSADVYAPPNDWLKRISSPCL